MTDEINEFIIDELRSMAGAHRAVGDYNASSLVDAAAEEIERLRRVAATAEVWASSWLVAPVTHGGDAELYEAVQALRPQRAPLHPTP